MHANADARPRPLTPEMLVSGYCQGVFPMAESRSSRGVQWFRPDPRAVLPLDGFRCPRSLRQVVRSERFEVRHDTAFDEVILACAEPRRYEQGTWINHDIIGAFGQLHRLGLAHSVEAWHDGHLVGGLYGVSIGAAFFGESMFHRAERGGSNASKVCLVNLVEHLITREFALLDVQFPNPHLAQFGVIEIRNDDYLRQLFDAVDRDVKW